jgi:hypothetical protein
MEVSRRTHHSKKSQPYSPPQPASHTRHSHRPPPLAISRSRVATFLRPSEMCDSQAGQASSTIASHDPTADRPHDGTKRRHRHPLAGRRRSPPASSRPRESRPSSSCDRTSNYLTWSLPPLSLPPLSVFL